MSLPTFIESTRVTVPVPRPQPPGAPHFHELEKPPESRLLDFDMEPQIQDQWCWAAVAVSVARCYDRTATVTQCTLVLQTLPAERNCKDCHSEDCDHQNELVTPLTNVGHFTPPILDREIKLVGGASEATVRTEIDAGRPIAIRIWQEGGHFVVVRGYFIGEGESFIHVADPTREGPTNSTYPFDRFISAGWHGRRWTHTYLTHPKGEGSNGDR